MKYSKLAIDTSLPIGSVYHLRLRQTEGFLRSLFSLLKLDADVPDHSTVSKRSAKIGRVQLGNSESKKPVHLIIDSTGVRGHVGQLRKPPKNRDYRRLHFGVDERTGEVLACELTSKSATDASRVPSLLRQVDRPIASARADAQYDDRKVDEALESHRPGRSPRVVIPTKKNARVKSGPANMEGAEPQHTRTCAAWEASLAQGIELQFAVQGGDDCFTLQGHLRVGDELPETRRSAGRG